ncbi:MAG: hypothetical protein ABI791_12180 [Acidobacteriota bacterium]
MYCPKCGTAEQAPETYCRHCGIFLPDFDTLKSGEQSPEMHIKANAVLSVLTITASLAIVLMLYLTFRDRETPVVIYPAAGLMIAIAAWQVQTFWRTMLLRRQIVQREPLRGDKAAAAFGNSPNESSTKVLDEPDLAIYPPASVTTPTTRRLKRR